jgi:hypothetical protein
MISVMMTVCLIVAVAGFLSILMRIIEKVSMDRNQFLGMRQMPLGNTEEGSWLAVWGDPNGLATLMCISSRTPGRGVGWSHFRSRRRMWDHDWCTTDAAFVNAIYSKEMTSRKYGGKSDDLIGGRWTHDDICRFLGTGGQVVAKQGEGP